LEKQQTMKYPITALKVSLAALAVCTGLAAQAAAPAVTGITLVPRLTIQSDLGTTNQIQYCTNLSQGWWLPLTNVVVTQSPYWFVDLDAPTSPQRFYRVHVTGPTPSGTVLIPAGTFTMGNCMDPVDGGPEELPLHTNYVSPFYLEVNLVTYTLWQQVYQWATLHGYTFDNAGSGKAPSHPAQNMNWYDSVKWCNARSEMEGLPPAYYTSAGQTSVYRVGQIDVDSGWVNWNAGYRLPTEAEWEKAARGGASGHRFPWTDADTTTHSRANYYADTPTYAYDVSPTQGYHPAFNDGVTPYTSPVGYFAPNGFGLYDMAGNVWERCWDCYDGAYYTSASGTDPRGPASSTTRTLRAGGWAGRAYGNRCAARGGHSPSNGNLYIGFRCVRGF
jgi:formylglycine-generating enzyme